MIAFTINRAGCPPVQEEGVLLYRSALARIADIGRHACVPLVFLVSGAQLLKLPRMSVLPQQLGPSLHAPARDRRGLQWDASREVLSSTRRQPVEGVLLYRSALCGTLGRRWRALQQLGLAVHGRSKSWIASSSRSGDKLIKVAKIQRTFAWPCARMTRRCWQMERVAAL